MLRSAFEIVLDILHLHVCVSMLIYWTSPFFESVFVLFRLMTDSAFCLDFMTRVCKAGAAIEDALGSAQDIVMLVS